MMKERPILFSAPMVRAIMEGRKTMTRRVIKPQPLSQPILCPNVTNKGQPSWVSKDIAGSLMQVCPYGQPGDRPWVRETTLMWRSVDGRLCDGDDGPIFRDDPAWDDCLRDGKILSKKYNRRVGWEVCPSIHMFREMSRIDLEVTAVRVERVQDISEEDARAEGVEWHDGSAMDRGKALYAFHCLWDSINAKLGYGWYANPWVWVIEFGRINVSKN
jgi:hypothetical protein